MASSHSRSNGLVVTDDLEVSYFRVTGGSGGGSGKRVVSQWQVVEKW